MTWTSTTVYPNAFFTSQADYCHKSSRESRAGVTSPSSSLPEPSKTSLEPDSSFCTPLLSIAGIAIIEVNNNNNYFITLFNEYKNITGCPVVYAKALLLIHPWEPMFLTTKRNTTGHKVCWNLIQSWNSIWRI